MEKINEFGDKTILMHDWIETFFDTFRGSYASNSKYDTFVGFIKRDLEIRISLIANRIVIIFVQDTPTKTLVNSIIKFFSVNKRDAKMPFVDKHYVSGNNRMIAFQYFFK